MSPMVMRYMIEKIAFCIFIIILIVFGIGGTFFPQKLKDYHVKIGKENFKAIGLDKKANNTWWHPYTFQYRIGGFICLLIAVWLIYQLIVRFISIS